MKKVFLKWIGTSKNVNRHYIKVSWEESGYILEKFLLVTEAKATELADKVDTEISVPSIALS